MSAARAGELREALNRSLRGKADVIEHVLACLLARGHLLLEDLPGLGKTTLAKAIADAVGGRFSRVQCTPDLLPGDITGFSVFNQKSREFDFLPGPVFSDVMLADEINRTTPRTQSALLEAMAERQVTVDNVRRRLSQTFFVIATLSSIGLPGLNGFVGEFLILLGAFRWDPRFVVGAGLGVAVGFALAVGLGVGEAVALGTPDGVGAWARTCPAEASPQSSRSMARIAGRRMVVRSGYSRS